MLLSLFLSLLLRNEAIQPPKARDPFHKTRPNPLPPQFIERRQAMRPHLLNHQHTFGRVNTNHDPEEIRLNSEGKPNKARKPP